MRLGAIRDVKCPHCEHRHQAYVKAETNWRTTCPQCGRAHETEASSRAPTYGNRRFTESEGESVRNGFHPGEVKLAKRMMPKTGDCIKSDGRVVYPDGRTARLFERELAQAKRRLGVPDRSPF